MNNTLEKSLKKELDTLNIIIDKKILRGLSYSAESRRHKYVVSSLSGIRREKVASSWFGRSFGFASII